MKKYIIFLFLLITTISLKTFTIDELILKINTNKFNEALKVYLIDHEVDVDEIVSLNTLKEEGLINGNLNINYEKNYYRVSKLSDSELKCESGMNFSAVTNWLNNKDKSNEIYFCKKETEGEEPEGDVFDPYKLCGDDSDKLFCEVITNAMEQEDEYKEEYLKNGKISTTSIEALDRTKLMFADRNIYTVYRDYFMNGEISSRTDFDMTLLEKVNYNNKELREIVYEESYTIGTHYSSSRALGSSTSGSVGMSYYQYADTYEITSTRNLQPTGKSWDAFVFNWSADKYFYNLPFAEVKKFIGKYMIFTSSKTGNKSQLLKILNVRGEDKDKDGEKETVYLRYKIYYFNSINERNYEKTLGKTEDEYGYSYYFRGDIRDNYVNFNNMCWRIVRIQGDGSVKLILESQLETCSEGMVNFYLNEEDEFQNAYLIGQGEYGNIGILGDRNVLLNYSYATNGMRNAFLSWFNQKFDNNDKKYLKQQRFCLGNLEEVVSNMEWLMYADWKYATLKCPDSYEVKTIPDYVATLTADELLYVGRQGPTYLTKWLYAWEFSTGDRYPELQRSNIFTLTANQIGMEVPFIYYINYDGTKLDNTSIMPVGCTSSSCDTYPYTDSHFGYRPVIVLNRNVLFKSGRGTVDNPYEVKL